jgi:hypothetical protein
MSNFTSMIAYQPLNWGRQQLKLHLRLRFAVEKPSYTAIVALLALAPWGGKVC